MHVPVISLRVTEHQMGFRGRLRRFGARPIIGTFVHFSGFALFNENP
jgi:hypothetical protein